MKFIALLLLPCTFTGCMTMDKAKGFLEKKKALDDICAKEFPAQTTGVNDSAYKAGRARIDSIFTDWKRGIDSIFEDLRCKEPSIFQNKGLFSH